VLCHQNATFDEDLFENEVFTIVEQPFTFDRSPFPAAPTGTITASFVGVV